MHKIEILLSGCIWLVFLHLRCWRLRNTCSYLYSIRYLQCWCWCLLNMFQSSSLIFYLKCFCKRCLQSMLQFSVNVVTEGLREAWPVGFLVFQIFWIKAKFIQWKDFNARQLRNITIKLHNFRKKLHCEICSFQGAIKNAHRTYKISSTGSVILPSIWSSRWLLDKQELS